MVKLTLQNYFSTTLAAGVTASTSGEIEFQLGAAPTGDFGYLIVDYLDDTLREEIFYHRKAGTSVFVYGVNRTNPQAHDADVEVQMNDSASIFNYLSDVAKDHFFMYKTGDSTVHITGGKIFDNGTYYTIPDKTDISLVTGTNYVYVDNGELESTTDTLTDKLVVGEIVVDGGGDITSFEHYNTMSAITGRTAIIIRGSAPPTTEGEDGDYYIDDTNKLFYGPKASGVWGAGFSYKGDTGSTGAQGPTGPAGSIEEAESETAQTIIDNYIQPDGAVVTTDDSTWIRVTLTDTSFIEYQEDQIITVDANGEFVSNEVITGVFGDDGITYDDGRFVDKITGTISFIGTPAYTNNIDNVFQNFNTFNKNVKFNGNVVFQYNVMAEDATVFDANLGLKQAVTWTTDQEMTFTNLIPGTSLMFAIVATGSADLTFGTASGFDADGDPTSYTPYSIRDESFPLTLGIGVHMFVAEVYTTGIHIGYAGQSVAI